ncbi:MAG: FAD:protein FMN transferase, partial [Anaerolineales bacterium]|nr:FAD:protein FMN transferase [Anaerolineales bacterium]
AEALAQVPGWFADWEQHLSRFRADSELMRLNGAGGRPQPVSAVLWEVLAAAVDAYQRSDGLVSPTLLAALEAAGYDQSFDALLAPPVAGAALALRPETDPAPTLTLDIADPLAAIVRDEAARTVQLLDGVQLDLGGVAKGWAAEQAARRLAGCGPALVEAGGDIAVSGPRQDGAPWPIGVADPHLPAADAAVLALSRGGVATSGRDYRRWQQGGVWRHHILDPRTGQPAVTDVLSATVVAPSLRDAELAAKAALILGSEEGLAWIEAAPDWAALLILDNGLLVESRRLAAYRVG